MPAPNRSVNALTAAVTASETIRRNTIPRISPKEKTRFVMKFLMPP
jgi:hypothetical protein